MTKDEKLRGRFLSGTAVMVYSILLAPAISLMTRLLHSILLSLVPEQYTGELWLQVYDISFSFVELAMPCIGTACVLGLAYMALHHTLPVFLLQGRSLLWVIGCSLSYSAVTTGTLYLLNSISVAVGDRIPIGVFVAELFFALVKLGLWLLLVGKLMPYDNTEEAGWRGRLCLNKTGKVMLSVWAGVAVLSAVISLAAYYFSEGSVFNRLLWFESRLNYFGISAVEMVSYSVSVALCYTLAGGRGASAPKPEEEPLPMSPEAERGERALRKLLKLWLIFQVPPALLGGFPERAIILLLCCCALFMYYGRSWARGIWFFYTVMPCLGAITSISVLIVQGSGLWQYRPITFLARLIAFSLQLPWIVVQVLISIRLLRPTDSIARYMIYKAVSPPTVRQLVWERRAKITGVCLLIFVVTFFALLY